MSRGRRGGRGRRRSTGVNAAAPAAPTSVPRAVAPPRAPRAVRQPAVTTPPPPVEESHRKVLIEKPILPRYPDQRIGVFVDVSNMYWAVRRLDAALNFRSLLESAVGERKLIRAVAYATSAGTEEEKKFFEALTKAGFEVKLKELQVFAGGKKKADWDVGMAMDMVRMGPLLDVAVLVSGDGDFVPVVEFLQQTGHLVEVMAFREGVAAKLVERADSYLDLGKDTRRYLIR
ncbi:MAG: NYN domain-containing protein [Candidatus Andersenbacteria bacterium]